jgi:(4-(4-[2-(gamma-L-glutamylamino)ethyl]phenoxymethyl)furan-2-yl)methanamine synthase
VTETLAIGWDLGGAHLKAAEATADGRIVAVWQVPCTLWRGLEHLTHAIDDIRPHLRHQGRHGLTMTGELVDLFDNRQTGVERLTTVMARSFPDVEIKVYAGAEGFRPIAEVSRHWSTVASANWHGSAAFAASCRKQGLFVDVGSTTTDLVPFRDGRVEYSGYSDAERLVSDELIYTGVTRTPIMAIAQRVPFADVNQRVMAEHFATVADVHRLTGELPEDGDQHATPDGRGKSNVESARRLARMLGRDADPSNIGPWRQLAWHLSGRQSEMLREAADRILARGQLSREAPVVGAGVGRFLARRLADQLQRPYVDFCKLVTGEAQATEWAARCAPAAAMAVLAARW